MSRALAVLSSVVFTGFAVAASPPEIVEAIAEKDRFLLTIVRQVPVQKTFTVEVMKDGRVVTETRVATVYESVIVREAVPEAKVKATDATGKDIAIDRLKQRLNTTQLVVISRGEAVPESYRKLFKDDVIFLQIDPK